MSSPPLSIDPDALEALHGAAWGWALSLARGDREFAADVLQDAYLAILEGKARYSGRSQYKTWVFGVIRMTAKSLGRKRAIFNSRFLTGAEAPPEPVAPPMGDPLTKAMADALAALPARQAQIAELVFAQDFTLEEAAKAMDITVGSARTHYARAKAALRTVLDRTAEHRSAA